MASFALLALLFVGSANIDRLRQLCLLPTYSLAGNDTIHDNERKGEIHLAKTFCRDGLRAVMQLENEESSVEVKEYTINFSPIS